MMRAAFDQGKRPKIDIINRATTPLGLDLGALAKSLQYYIDWHFAPIWGTACTIRVARKIRPGAWAIVIADTADAEGALGYHFVTEFGLPASYVFVEPIRNLGGSVSVTISHELVEMLIDPAINLWADSQDGRLWAYEVADAVEAERDAFPVRGFALSNFVYPAFFEAFRKPGSAKFDHLGQLERPFSLRPGGYSLLWTDSGLELIFGSKRAERRFAQEDRRGHRSQWRRAR